MSTTVKAHSPAPCPAPTVSGLTFVEVLAVLGLAGILLLAALPQLTVPGSLSTAAAARQLAFDLRLARQLAIARRVNHSLELTPVAGPYTSYTIRNEATSATEPDFPKEIPSTITATGRAEFTFYPEGCVDDDGTGASCAGTDGSVTLTAGSVTHRVDVIWPTGRVKVVRP